MAFPLAPYVFFGLRSSQKHRYPVIRGHSLGRLDVVVQRLGFVPHLHERVLDYVADRYDADEPLLLDHGYVADFAFGHLLDNRLHGLGLSAKSIPYAL
jgi:hypothetical protein